MATIWNPRLDEASRGWRDLAADLTARHFAPRAAEIDREQRYPAENVELLYSSGIATMFLPAAHGGGGASLTAFCAAMEQMAGGCASTSGIAATLQLGATPLLLSASADQKATFLGAVTRDRKAISFALSERNAGSDPASMETVATREVGGWRIRGEKCWIGNGGICDLYVVFAQTAPGTGRRGIAAFIVDRDADGIDDDAREDKMGMRGTVNASVVLDTWVPADRMLSPPGSALRLALATLNIGRITVAAQSIGLAMAAYGAACRRAVERTTFGSPLIDHQGVGFKLADLATRISAGRMLAYEAARAFDDGEDVNTVGAQAKLFCSEVAHEAANVGVQVFGGQGFVKPNLVERIYRDQKATEIYEGTSEIQRVVLARAIKAEFKPMEERLCAAE